MEVRLPDLNPDDQEALDEQARHQSEVQEKDSLLASKQKQIKSMKTKIAKMYNILQSTYNYEEIINLQNRQIAADIHL